MAVDDQQPTDKMMISGDARVEMVLAEVKDQLGPQSKDRNTVEILYAKMIVELRALKDEIRVLQKRQPVRVVKMDPGDGFTKASSTIQLDPALQ